MAFDPTGALQQTLLDHGVNAQPTPGGILVPEHDLIFSTGVYPKHKHPNVEIVQLDVRVESKRLPHGPLIESCAGWAPTEEQAIKNALAKFLQASLHVLVSSLIDPSACGDQVEWETWSGRQCTWNVCLGPLTCVGTAPDSLECSDLLDFMRDDLIQDLSADIHWIRVYFSSMSPPFVYEALLDNQDWPALRKTLESWPWPSGEYSARMFFMMVPRA